MNSPGFKYHPLRASEQRVKSHGVPGCSKNLREQKQQTWPGWKQIVSVSFAPSLAGIMIGGGWCSASLGWIGVSGFALFFWLQVQQQTLRGAIWQSYLTGFFAFAIACSWLPSTARYLSEIGVVASCVCALAYYSFQSLSLVLFAVLWRAMRSSSQRAWLIVPFLWVTIEHLLPTLFPWPPAVLLTGDLPILQIAELGGVDLVSVLVLSISVFLAWSLELARQSCSGAETPRGTFCVWSMILLSLVGVRLAGSARLQQIEAEMKAWADTQLRVGLIQAAPGFTDSNRRMVEATRAMNGLIDLAVWPESALGNYSRELRDFNDPNSVENFSIGAGSGLVPFPQLHCPLLAGADRWDDIKADGQPDRHYVSALLIDQKQHLVGARDKIRLMPYGEYIPGESFLPFLRTWWGDKRMISAGDSPTTIGRIGGYQVGALLCCEDMHPDFVRKVVNQGADLLVTLGNGSAFDSEIALSQHFRISLLRAIEHRLYFLRCTSAGVSGLVGPSGRVLHQLPAGQEVAAVLSIPRLPPSMGVTFFTRKGGLLSTACGVFAILIWLRWRTRDRSETGFRRPARRFAVN